jgi:Pectinacetylesterase
MRARLAAALAATALSACASNTTPVTKKAYDGQPPLGTPISADEAPAGKWSWVSVPDAVCADGSPAGLGVNPGTGPDLVVFFDGGGACWSYGTCTAGFAFDRRYGPAEFATEQADYLPGSLLDRDVLPPSLAGATLVFVPYCTGDVHGGDSVKTYTAPLDASTWRHVGHANVMRFLERLGATWPSPRKLVVAGSSAGGFGAVASYEAFRWYWPDAEGYLVDDSGPPLVGDDISASMRNAWYDAWRLGVSLDPVSVDCRDDLSAAITALAKAHKDDRIALLSHVDDLVMSTFLEQPTLGAALDRLEGEVFAPAGAHVFYAPGTDHMLLPTIAAESAGGTTLADWLEADFSDAPAWADATP